MKCEHIEPSIMMALLKALSCLGLSSAAVTSQDYPQSKCYLILKTNLCFIAGNEVLTAFGNNIFDSLTDNSAYCRQPKKIALVSGCFASDSEEIKRPNK